MTRGNGDSRHRDGSGNPVREYTYYPGVDRPHSVRVSSGQTYYYALDNPGHVVGLIDGTNQLVSEYRYTPWGELPAGAAGPADQPLGFMAREWDDAAGLYQVRARWYDPQQGRFISEDPIGLEGGLALYAYAGNDPINKIDPYGLCELWAEYRIHTDSKGNETVEILRFYWKGDDCGSNGRGGGGSNAEDRRPTECQALASAAGIVARLTTSDDQFIDVLSKGVGGISRVWHLKRGSNRLPVSATGGYKPELGGAEMLNGRHWVGNLWAAAHLGVLEARALSRLREVSVFQGASMRDHNLSKTAHVMAFQMMRGGMTRKDAQSWIQENVCQ